MGRFDGGHFSYVLAGFSGIDLISLYDDCDRPGEQKVNVVVLASLGNELVSLLVFDQLAMLDQSIRKLRITLTNS